MADPEAISKSKLPVRPIILIASVVLLSFRVPPNAGTERIRGLKSEEGESSTSAQRWNYDWLPDNMCTPGEVSVMSTCRKLANKSRIDINKQYCLLGLIISED